MQCWLLEAWVKAAAKRSDSVPLQIWKLMMVIWCKKGFPPLGLSSPVLPSSWRSRFNSPGTWLGCKEFPGGSNIQTKLRTTVWGEPAEHLEYSQKRKLAGRAADILVSGAILYVTLKMHPEFSLKIYRPLRKAGCSQPALPAMKSTNISIVFSTDRDIRTKSLPSANTQALFQEQLRCFWFVFF